MGVIEDFLAEYEREYDFYTAVARLVQQRIEADLRTSGIRAIVSSRAKRADRVLDKLQKRNVSKNYLSGAEIRDDLVDFAGVRVALYFPSDRDRVNQAIATLFTAVKPPKEFPNKLESSSQVAEYEKKFPGYGATHHRIRLIDGDNEKRYASAMVEVQVASVLMHAWAEVEHDLVYKPFQGRLSEDEYAILDELNGLVLAGEISLERLQRAGERRIQAQDAPFDNQYELAAHLFNHVRSTFQKEAGATAMGRVDVLLELLRRLELDNPKALAPYLVALDADFEQRPVADQLADVVSGGDEDRHRAHEAIRSELVGNEPATAWEDALKDIEFSFSKRAVSTFRRRIEGSPQRRSFFSIYGGSPLGRMRISFRRRYLKIYTEDQSPEMERVLQERLGPDIAIGRWGSESTKNSGFTFKIETESQFDRFLWAVGDEAATPVSAVDAAPIIPVLGAAHQG
jgi:ppGpp synthetase/RelA/SpoT-type nucleotidyltranferase